jgi:hypothetical protein
MKSEQERLASTGGFLLDPHAVVRRLSSTGMKVAAPAEPEAHPVDVPISVAPPPDDGSSG